MLGRTGVVLMYYLGFGFTILLGWAACHPDRALDPAAVRRYLRWTSVAAVVGILHPAIALASRDILSQVGLELPNNDDTLTTRHHRATTIVNTCLVLSVIPTAIVLSTTLL
jgi:hypothetical protein